VKVRLYTLSPKISRRGFCGGSIAAVALGACGGGDPRISVGGIDGGFDLASVSTGPVLDLSQPPGSDLATHEDLAGQKSPDLASGSCSGTVSGGAASAIVEGTPVFISASKLYVCRDAGGLYAMTSVCTHQGCKVTPEATDFYCNCHGATFDLNGQSPTSPAKKPLNHYALCVNAAGDIEIDPSQIVDPSTRA
jgi:nitrite reductase/ring-hydroxylating ferredoxin subunit